MPRRIEIPIPHTLPELLALVQELVEEKQLRRRRKAKSMMRWRRMARAIKRDKELDELEAQEKAAREAKKSGILNNAFNNIPSPGGDGAALMSAANPSWKEP